MADFDVVAFSFSETRQNCRLLRLPKQPTLMLVSLVTCLLVDFEQQCFLLVCDLDCFEGAEEFADEKGVSKFILGAVFLWLLQ